MSPIIALVWITLTVLSAYPAFSNQIALTKHPNEKKIIADELTKLHYDNGYATFWNANVFTELSDGGIRVHDWCDGGGGNIKNIIDVNTTYKWLQIVENDTSIPEGKVFLLFDHVDYENFIWKSNLREKDIIITTDNYIVYGYKNYRQMIDSIYKDYVFDFSGSNWISEGGGVDADGVRTLFPTGISFGPYLPFWKGRYRVTVCGNNLLSGEYYSTYDSGEEYLNSEMIKKTDGEVIFDIICTEDVKQAETVIRNVSNENLTITQIRIHRM